MTKGFGLFGTVAKHDKIDRQGGWKSFPLISKTTAGSE
jgi:hypothetical protein